jgi:hypothetical protein
MQELPRRFIFWLDGVGGWLVCLGAQVRIGQAAGDADVEIPIYADISRLHAVLSRDSEGTLLEALRATKVNHKPADKALLRDGDRIEIGNGCLMTFSQPVPITTTARLELTSRHRMPLSVNGIILMADSCILGPAEGAHIIVPDLRRTVILTRSRKGFHVRTTGDVIVDGHRHKDRADLTTTSTVGENDFRLTLEPLK